MENLLGAIVWKQFGAAIDMLDNAVAACPDALWRQPVWHDPSVPPQRTQFWYVAYHALFWLDLYLFGSEEGFAPPAPFAMTEMDDSASSLPNQPYSRQELRAYLVALRQKCRSVIETMTDEQAHLPVTFPWMREGEVVSYAELQLYSMRHTQEHAAQLSLMLGQHGVPGDQIDWVARASERIKNQEATMDGDMSKARLLDDLRGEEARWEALLQDIGEEHMTQPDVAGGWSIKDIVAHLTGWRRWTVARLQADLRHEPAPSPHWPAHLQTDDEINAWIYAANRDLPLSDVLSESRSVLRRLRETLDAFPEADLMAYLRAKWTEGAPPTGAAFFDHFHEEHEPDMRAWLERIRREQR
jgi:uncharacterized damage-inducible protein DinB